MPKKQTQTQVQKKTNSEPFELDKNQRMLVAFWFKELADKSIPPYLQPTLFSLEEKFKDKQLMTIDEVKQIQSIFIQYA